MKRFSVAYVWLLVAGSLACMTALTPAGQKITVVTDAQKEQFCQTVSVISTSEAMGSSGAGDAESAMNQARNRAAQLGGDAIRIIKIDPSPLQTIVTAEVLRCTMPTPNPTPAGKP